VTEDLDGQCIYYLPAYLHLLVTGKLARCVNWNRAQQRRFSGGYCVGIWELSCDGATWITLHRLWSAVDHKCSLVRATTSAWAMKTGIDIGTSWAWNTFLRQLTHIWTTFILKLDLNSGINPIHDSDTSGGDWNTYDERIAFPELERLGILSPKTTSSLIVGVQRANKLHVQYPKCCPRRNPMAGANTFS